MSQPDDWTAVSVRSRNLARPSLRPGQVLYVIGDIHGHAELLGALLDAIRQDMRRLPEAAGGELILLGTYVDIGPDSRGVVDQVLHASKCGELGPVTALKGDHETAMLRFLQDAPGSIDWRRMGAGATLGSYGVPTPARVSSNDMWARARSHLLEALPRDHLSFFLGLVPSATRGDYVFANGRLSFVSAPADGRSRSARLQQFMSKFAPSATPVGPSERSAPRFGPGFGRAEPVAFKLEGAQRTLLAPRR